MTTIKTIASGLKVGDVIATGTYAGQTVLDVSIAESHYMSYKTNKVIVVTSQLTPVVVEREVPNYAQQCLNATAHELLDFVHGIKPFVSVEHQAQINRLIAKATGA